MLSSRASAVFGALVFLIASSATQHLQSLSYDELFTVWVSSRPWSEVVPQANLDGFTPPLFYLLVKVVASLGLRAEGLRIVPVVFASVAVFVALRACERLFGASSRVVALLVIPGSAFLYTFSHELRPYSAFLACAFVFLGQIAGPPDSRRDARAAGAALLSTAFSYLGAMLVAIWVFECRSRFSRLRLLMVSAIAAWLSVPGVAKLIQLVSARAAGAIEWSEALPSARAVLFGLAPMTLSDGVERAGWLALGALLVLASGRRADPPLRFLSRVFVGCGAMLFVLNAVVRMGFAPRYFAVLAAPLLLVIVAVLSRAGRAGRVFAAVFLAVNITAVVRYLTSEPQPREDWRQAMTALWGRLGPDGVLLAFPFHHAAVATLAYTPAMKMGGGYTSRSGPVYWYEPPATFHGYAFDDLVKLPNADDALRRIARVSDVCVLSDEPDPAKTAIVFEALRRLNGASELKTGDVRLRALCRAKG